MPAQYEFEIPNDQELLEDGSRLLLERTLAAQGKWRVHKYDPDDLFPSDFHAHSLESEEKLDLYTGNVFSGRTYRRRVSKKAMRHVHRELSSCGDKYYEESCRSRDRFSYL